MVLMNTAAAPQAQESAVTDASVTPLGRHGALLEREVKDVREAGFEVLAVNDKSWTCRLNYFPHITQNCRFNSWYRGTDGRVRPGLTYRTQPGNHNGQPRVKLQKRGGQPQPQPLPEPSQEMPPPAPDDSLTARLGRLEAKVDRILAALGIQPG